MKKIVVVDYGMGNLRSVAQALHAVAPEKDILVSGTVSDLKEAERIVLPGQGAMPDCMTSLEKSGLKDALLDAARKKPVFGVCVGEQMLFDWSEEGDTRCLGLLPGKVVRFRLDDRLQPDGSRLKVPQMGWNQVKQVNPIRYGKASPITVSFILYTVFMSYHPVRNRWSEKRNTAYLFAVPSRMKIFSPPSSIPKRVQMSGCNCTATSSTGIRNHKFVRFVQFIFLHLFLSCCLFPLLI